MTAGDPFLLTDRVAVVTGAGSGIGQATAEILAGAGATVVCADIDGGAAEATAARVRAAGRSASAAEVDVARATAVDTVIDETIAAYGRLDVMANIAGIIVGGSVVEMTDDDLDRVIAVNLRGVFYGCRAATRVMVEQRSGSIVNMSSGAIDAPAPGLSGYAMTKAAVAQLTRNLATEVAPHGVRVNAVAPGFVLTGMTGRHFTDPDGTVDEARREAALTPMRKRTPLRDIGQPSDIGYAVLYLCSDAARFVTGQILRPNGGVSMPW